MNEGVCREAPSVEQARFWSVPLPGVCGLRLCGIALVGCGKESRNKQTIKRLGNTEMARVGY